MQQMDGFGFGFLVGDSFFDGMWKLRLQVKNG